jgi:hypothetical protein
MAVLQIQVLDTITILIKHQTWTGMSLAGKELIIFLIHVISGQDVHHK